MRGVQPVGCDDMWKRALFALASLLAVYLAVGLPHRSLEKAGAKKPARQQKVIAQQPQLQSAGPLRRLGASDFRLTIRGGQRRSFRFSPDGKLLAGANWDEVKIWTFPEG